jgi:hypothetical protein
MSAERDIFTPSLNRLERKLDEIGVWKTNLKNQQNRNVNKTEGILRTYCTSRPTPKISRTTISSYRINRGKKAVNFDLEGESI